MSEAQRLILDLAVEDAIGLWEIVWRSAQLKPAPTRHELVETTLAMVEEGLLRVLSVTEEECPLDNAQAASEIQKAANWSVPDVGEHHVRVVATESGERLYYGR